MPAAPAPHLVDVLLEAVSDRQAVPGGPAAAAAGTGAPRRPDAHAAKIRNSSCSARSAPLACSMPAAPAPHLVDVLLEAVSDRQAVPGGPAAAAAGTGAPRRPDAHAAKIRNSSCSARSAPLACSMPAAPAPHLVDVLLEAVSDRQACAWWASCCSGRRRHRCAAATRCARGQDPQTELQRAIGAATSRRPT